MYIRRRWTFAPFLDKVWGKPIVHKVGYLYRMGWKYIPEVMFAIPFGVVSCIGLVYTAERLGPHPPKKYHQHILIYRPGDPRIKDIPEKVDLDL